MADSTPIIIDKRDGCFLISGRLPSPLEDKRLQISLKRLGYYEEQGSIRVPFEEHKEAYVLQELQEILEKFGFTYEVSENVRADLESFDREERTFKEFSEKARDIRDNRFKDIPELVDRFDTFQRVVREKMQRQLYNLQLLSAYHMAFAQNACNFAVPGAGKTSIVYAAYAYLKSLAEDDDRHIDKLMVIGPLSSFAPWENEYTECFGQKPSVRRLSGDATISRAHKEEHLYSGSPAEITLIYHGGVDSLKPEIISFLKRNKTMVVVDEAHRIKNPDGMWGKSVVEIGKEARARVILTGTPVPNGYEDLFNLYQFLYPYKYRDILGFHYGNLQDMTKKSEPDSDRVHTLIQNISPYFIRIKKKDLNLPPVNDYLVEVSMDDRQREIYDFIESKYVDSFKSDGSADVKDILNKAKLIRLRQAATNPALLQRTLKDTLNQEDYEERRELGGDMPEEFQDDSQILSKIRSYHENATPAKFIAAKDLAKEKIANGEKLLIWTIFIQNAKELQKYLNDNGIYSELLIGEVEQSDRESAIKRFNDSNDTSLPVLIANPFSVAESISLHKGCHNALYLERDYNCSNFIQSKDRIHRVGLHPGQETNYYYFVSKNSIDGVIQRRLEEKVERMESIINQDIPLFARMNDADETDLIRALLDDYARRA